MSAAMRRITIAGCIAALLAAGAWTASTLRAPDPRGRAGWGAPPQTLTNTPSDVELFLPACAIDAIVVHGDAPAGTQLVATLTGATTVRVVLDEAGRAAIPVARSAPPSRQRVRLRLTSTDAPVPLDSARPFALDHAGGSVFGLLPCAVEDDPSTAWLLTAVVLTGLAGLGWVIGVLIAGQPRAAAPASARPRIAPVLAAALVTTTVVTYAFVVPPFEPPDELAHLQYARYVALTGTLPQTVPVPDSEWRAAAYEFVQQPLYYVAAAGLIRAAGDPRAAPAPLPEPHSRLAGGPDVNIYRHPDTSSSPRAVDTLRVLRWLSIVMAAATAWCVVSAVAVASGNWWLGAVAGVSLALVPQWCAVMGSVSTDPPATLAAAVVTLLWCYGLQAPAQQRWSLAAGLVTGVAYAVKATTIFLVPMGLAALWCVSRSVSRRRTAGHLARFVIGILLTAAWIPLRAWLVFGDPLARAFKRDVLATGGFTVVEGPPILSQAFASQMRSMVFEPFWARFGSLGAGPMPGTRLWWIYAVATIGLLCATAAGLAVTARGFRIPRPASDRAIMVGAVMVSAVGIITGVALWAWVNLVPQADVIVHWTPRHLLPLTAPLLVVAAGGVQYVSLALPDNARAMLRVLLGIGLLVLAVAGLAVLRSVVLGFHFGY